MNLGNIGSFAVEACIWLRKEINRLLSKGMSNMYLKVAIEKK